MNPDTNSLEMLRKSLLSDLVRPDGTPVPNHWSIYKVGESVVVKDYTWQVVHIGEKHMLLEPVGPVVVSVSGEDEE